MNSKYATPIPRVNLNLPKKPAVAYIAVDTGVDGRGQPRIVHATWNVDDMERWAAKNQNKGLEYLLHTFSVPEHTKTALSKLDGLDRLVLQVHESRLLREET